ncbi:MAG TPA: DMT family transporter [Rubrobacter sp.]|nr:DMT family transporter [Rubrobacter sp.]
MTEVKSKASLLTEASLILAAVLWGTNYAATKFAAQSIPPVSIVAVRFLVAGLLMYLVLRVLEPGSRLARKDLLPMAGLGCLGVGLGQTTFTFGVSLTSAANTGFIFATAPVWGLLFGFLLGLERPTWRGISGLGLSILGVGVIFYEGLGVESASLIGDLLVLLAAMGFGAYTVLSLRLLGRYSPLAVATYPILFGGPLVLLLSVPFFAGAGWGGVGAGAWAAVAFSAVFATAFAFSAWQRGVSRIGANRVLVYQYLISLTGVASGVVFFGEVLGAEKIVGGVVTLVGVYLARRQ